MKLDAQYAQCAQYAQQEGKKDKGFLYYTKFYFRMVSKYQLGFGSGL